MFTWKGKQQAVAGTYWDISTGERLEMRDREILPGSRSKTYIKASGTTVVLLGPVLGLIFAIFLPFIGIAMATYFAGKKVAGMARRAFRGTVTEAGKALTFGWRPLQAYLANKRKESKKSGQN